MLDRASWNLKTTIFGFVEGRKLIQLYVDRTRPGFLDRKRERECGRKRGGGRGGEREEFTYVSHSTAASVSALEF